MTDSLNCAITRFRHLSPSTLDACRSALASPRYWDYQYKIIREGSMATLEVVTESDSHRKDILALMTPILKGVTGIEVEHFQENQDLECPRRFAPGWSGWFEENRQLYKLNFSSTRAKGLEMKITVQFEVDSDKLEDLTTVLSAFQGEKPAARKDQRPTALLTSYDLKLKESVADLKQLLGHAKSVNVNVTDVVERSVVNELKSLKRSLDDLFPATETVETLAEVLCKCDTALMTFIYSQENISPDDTAIKCAKKLKSHLKSLIAIAYDQP